MIEYTTNEALCGDVVAHLGLCSNDFIPPLRDRVDLNSYAIKLRNNATCFEAWDDAGALVGLLAVYEECWFVTNVSVLSSLHRQGIATELLNRCADHARARGAGTLRLRVNQSNAKALSFYSRHGFVLRACTIEGEAEMMLDLKKGRRDFDAEARDTPTHRYAYDFDTEVMHPMMIRTFEPWFNLRGQTLELGSYEGAFTERLISKLLWQRDCITCVEASPQAAQIALKRFNDVSLYGAAVRVINSTFEKINFHEGKRFDNIFCTHVLEHLDDPVLVLRRVNDEWLAPGGRLFLAVPNANAASRRIAVHMGLVENCMAVTPDEEAHGHRRTYDLDLLEYHARLAWLKVVSRGGIFFKALANFQFDRAKAAGIIDDTYLEGCYRLGQQFPDLCASVYLICEKGEAK